MLILTLRTKIKTSLICLFIYFYFLNCIVKNELQKKKKKLKEEYISYFCQIMCGLKISLPGISFTISFMHFITTKHLHITENGV